MAFFRRDIFCGLLVVKRLQGHFIDIDARVDVCRVQLKVLEPDTFRCHERTAVCRVVVLDIRISNGHLVDEWLHWQHDITELSLLAFQQEGIIGGLAPTCYSYYGFQMDASELLEHTVPKVAERMLAENVEAVLLTPA